MTEGEEAHVPPVVTILIPARDEAEAIGTCLDHVLAQRYPSDRIEIVVVVGGSTDHTAEVARARLADAPVGWATILERGEGSTPGNLNAGLARARGEIVCRVDARSRIPPDYVRTAVDRLTSDSAITVIGGSQVATTDAAAGTKARAIAHALRNPVVTGLSRYRRGRRAGPSDTVYLGSFRRAELLDAGGWDERLSTNQDFELNRRMSSRGLVWYDPELEVGYVPRATLEGLAAQYRRFGRWKAAGWVEGVVPLTPRHVVLLLAPVAGVSLLWAVARRSRIAAAGLVLLGGVAVEAQTRDRARPAERLLSPAAASVIVGSWYAGVLEQGLRHLAGQRLIGNP